MSQGAPCLAAVCAAFPGTSQRTVQRWLQQARGEGLLPAAKPGSNWSRTPSAEAVADALGVSYERLVIALREHADGYLRIGAAEEGLARQSLSEKP
jgi:hypothetical protein